MKRISFYYKDSLDLKKVFPGKYKYSLLFPDDNVVINNGIIRLREPDRFDPSRIHNIVRVYPHKYDYFKIEVSIRCWRDDTYQLKEITKHSGLKQTRLWRMFFRFVKKIHPLSDNVHLLTIDSVSYFSQNQKLIKKENGKITIVGKMPLITDPIYYEFLPFGREAFLRTGYCIYQSSQGMTIWKKIHEGKRAIKNSMIWIEEEKALLFSEYTPGLKLDRHYLYKYYPESGQTKTVFTFYTPDEHEKEGKNPYCRHIHTLMRDPYTGDIYMGVGDSDDESAIYRSVDNGNSFSVLGCGSQAWRTLSFFFTEEFLFWNTDSPDPQFISRVRRDRLKQSIIKDEDVVHFPLYNSASWNTYSDRDEDMYIMSASCEGTLYDNNYRIYGIIIDDGVPIVYNLFEDMIKDEKKISRSHQLFVLGKDCDGKYWFYDTCKMYYRVFVLTKQ